MKVSMSDGQELGPVDDFEDGIYFDWHSSSRLVEVWWASDYGPWEGEPMYSHILLDTIGLDGIDA